MLRKCSPLLRNALVCACALLISAPTAVGAQTADDNAGSRPQRRSGAGARVKRGDNNTTAGARERRSPAVASDEAATSAGTVSLMPGSLPPPPNDLSAGGGTDVKTSSTEALTAPPGVAPEHLTATIPITGESGRTVEFSAPTDTILSSSLALPPMPSDIATELEIFDATSTATAVASSVRLPDSPLPPGEMDALTTASARSVKMSLMDVVCRSLSCNQALQVERLRPEVSNASIESAWGAFDTTLDASYSASERQSSTLGARPKNAPDTRTEDTRFSRSQDASIGLSGRAPTGTNYSLTYDASRSESNSSYPFYTSSLNLNITQNLLKGAGCEVNLVNVKTAQNNFVSSLYSLQDYLNNQVTNVQTGYFNLYLAFETLRIRRQAYEVARQQREQVETFVRVGRSAPLEALSAQAEEASRINDIINAAADLKRQQLLFLRLINPVGFRGGWRSMIAPVEPPVLPSENLVPEEHVRLAQRYRPDLRQAEIDLSNGELSVMQTENGLLPSLDLVTQLGVAGNGDTLGDSNKKVGDTHYPNSSIGLQFSLPLQNRTARAAYRRARFQRDQAEQSICNLRELIEVDVRTAIIEVERTRRLISSTLVTLRLREASLAAEQEKFRLGRSTQLLVAQAQRDLTQAQLEEVSARVANIRAYLQLYQSEGTVLQRRGILPVMITANSGVN